MSLVDNPAYKAGHKAGDKFFREMRQRSTIDMIAGGIMTVVIVGIVLNELLTLQLVSNSSGPFSDLLENTIPQIGTASLTLVVLGFLAAGGSVALSMFRGGGF